ncbi:MAG TPA: hypothetical protein VM364_22190 [Vicinamibacterales bacterium]|nr:hypothetical protein [Vicinamibacterales bacterium]
MRAGAAAVATVLLALSLGTPEPSASAPVAVLQRAGAMTLAVLRRDGIVMPFAAFDGRRWRAPWPAGISSQELPISIRDVPRQWWGGTPLPERMTLWTNGARAGEVALQGVTTLPLMCEPRIALRSDYTSPAPLPPPFERPYPKDGLLVHGDATVHPIASVQKDSPDWQRMPAVIADEFNRAETRAATQFTRWIHPVPAERRRLRPIAVEAMYRTPGESPDSMTWFVEAVREYPPGPDETDGCGLVTYGHGWVFSDAKKRLTVRLSARVTYCDRKDVAYVLPFGYVQANDRIYWVYQYSGHDEELYEVARPTPREIEYPVVYRAGVCR